MAEPTAAATPSPSIDRGWCRTPFEPRSAGQADSHWAILKAFVGDASFHLLSKVETKKATGNRFQWPDENSESSGPNSPICNLYLWSARNRLRVSLAPLNGSSHFIVTQIRSNFSCRFYTQLVVTQICEVNFLRCIEIGSVGSASGLS